MRCRGNPKYWGRRAAGIMFMAADTGRIMLGLRSRRVMEGGTWGVFGGKLEGDESAAEGAARESEEETGISVDVSSLLTLYVFSDSKADFQYTTMLCIVPDEILPELNWEHDDFGWFDPRDILQWSATPLHPGVLHMLSQDGILEKLVEAGGFLRGDKAYAG